MAGVKVIIDDPIKEVMKPFDGHFWVEKDGQVIADPYFSWYDTVKEVQKCEGDAKYCPAPPLVQSVMIALAKKTLKTSLKKASLLQGHTRADVYMKEMSKDIDIDEALESKLNSLRNGECHITAFAIQKKHGGEIVFGSMGWKKVKSDKIHWEFGGADWTTVAKFMCKK